MDWVQLGGAVVFGVGIVAFLVAAADVIDWGEGRRQGAATIVGLIVFIVIVGFLFEPRWVGY